METFFAVSISDGLADNFKTLFRPTMMTAPDLHFVVETSLLALGIADHVHVTDRLLELLDDGGLGRYLPAGSPQSAYNLRSVKVSSNERAVDFSSRLVAKDRC